MPRALLISVRFHDGRYHGVGDWPPSPARLFQALVAGAAKGGTIPPAERAALAWLEGQGAPEIVAPPARVGRPYNNYVPNNDLDAVGGDPTRIADIRAPKHIRPRLFDTGIPLLYLWRFDEDEAEADALVALADRLYQLGRGVDMAWASAEIPSAEAAEAKLTAHGGTRHRPSQGREGTMLACPMDGTLKSLEERFIGMGARLAVEGKGKKAQQLFTQPPKARFTQVAYDCPPTRLLFDIRDLASDKATPEFAAQSLRGVVRLVETLRDGAAGKLAEALPDQSALIERVFIGRNATEADKASRIRIIPLPSIGHHHAESSIRRILLEIPPDCPLPRGDIGWAFAAFIPHDPKTGELAGWQLVEAKDRRMLGHYGIAGDWRDVFRLWRTVIPAALPERAARRRIDPRRMQAEAKDAAERIAEEGQAAKAVRAALRHAGIETPVEHIRVQHEPFSAKGARAETFAPGTRFAKARLWHIEIAFAEPRTGPLVIGDGRYLGLGLMAPVKDTWRDEIVFPLLPETRVAITDSAALLHAVRRALMALSRNSRDDVPRLFSGHEPDGAPASSGGHEHIFLAADDADRDGRVDRLIVAAPWACDRSGHAPRQSDRALFDRVVSSLGEVRAGKLGVIALGLPRTLAANDPVFGPARTWKSRTSYRPTRHASRGKDPAAAVMQDAITECERRGLPRPEAEVLELNSGPSGGSLAACVRLRFAVAVKGPIMLGRNSHMGGGLFAAVDE